MRKICSIVVAAHLLLLCLMAFAVNFKGKKQKKALVVKSIVQNVQPTILALPTPVKSSSPASKPSAVSPPSPSPPRQLAESKPKKTTLPAPKKEAKKGSSAILEKKATAQKKPASTETMKLLKELEQSLTRIEKPASSAAPSSARSTLQRPLLKIDSLALFGEKGDEEYEAALIATLHEELSLPEFGEVKIKLTLQNNGRFVKMEIVGAKNAKNQRYLEEELPRMHFPRFSGALVSRKESAFLITFCNKS